MADSFSSFMATKQAPASAPSFSTFMGNKTPVDSGHEPGFMDDVKASANFLGGELSGAGSGIVNGVNPVNIVKGVYRTVTDPTGVGQDIGKSIHQLYVDYQNGDMEALSHGIGNLAGGVIAGKVLPEVPGATAKYGARVAENAPALGKAAGAVAKDSVTASSGNLIPTAFAAYFHNPESVLGALLYKAAANVVKGGNVGAFKNALVELLSKPTTAEAITKSSAHTPGWAGLPEPAEVTPVDQPGPNADGSHTLPSGRIVGGIQNQQPVLATSPLGPRPAPAWQGIQPTAPVAPASVQPIPGALPSGRVPGDISAQVKISPKISVTSASDAMGTTPTPLDASTQTRLANASKDGSLSSLPAAQKADIVKAVKSGDDSKVADILDNHAGVRTMAQDVANKINILARYATDHGLDLDTITPGDRQSVADLAVQHAQKLGLPGLPRAGKYRGISDSTMEAVRQALTSNGGK